MGFDFALRQLTFCVTAVETDELALKERSLESLEQRRSLTLPAGRAFSILERPASANSEKGKFPQPGSAGKLAVVINQ